MTFGRLVAVGRHAVFNAYSTFLTSLEVIEIHTFAQRSGTIYQQGVKVKKSSFIM